MGLCPFHGEKSPSFTVSPTKQFYHCFGCGAHGSAIGFLMEYTGLTYVEAIRQLAYQAGLQVPEETQPRPQQSYYTAASESGEAEPVSLTLSDVMVQATQYYRRQLRTAPKAIEYLKGRGLTGEIAAHFGLGYAPDDWRNLAEVFDNYESEALVESGLVITKEDEHDATDSPRQAKRYDRFRDRIMFPIRNTKGQVIGFGGRVMGQGEPKYLNSPETPLFHKGSELYGLFEARQAIRQHDYVLVVEGYMDVVALAQFGIANVVATLGTACTSTHLQKLMRQTDRVVFSFDGDAAGRRAARRALEAALPHAEDNKTIQFLFLPTEHDPDSYVREYGVDAFLQAVSGAMPLSQFLIQQVCEDTNLNSAEGRAQALFQARPLLNQLPRGALRMQVTRELGHQLDTPHEEIDALVQSFAESHPKAEAYDSRQSSDRRGVANQAGSFKAAQSGNRQGKSFGKFSGKNSYGREKIPEGANLPRLAPESLESRVVQALLSHPDWFTQISPGLLGLLHDVELQAQVGNLNHLINLIERYQVNSSAALGDLLTQDTNSQRYELVYLPLLTKLVNEEIIQQEDAEIEQLEFEGALIKLERKMMVDKGNLLAKQGGEAYEQWYRQYKNQGN